MKVAEICTRDPARCGPDSTLADAAWIMWERECRSLPVVDAAGRVVGMLTDQDITMAAIYRNRRPTQVFVRETMTLPVVVCGLQNDARAALQMMAAQRVRRGHLGA